MAGRLKRMNIQPDFILSSNAIRALHTATIFGRVLGIDFDRFAIAPDIYESNQSTVFNKLTRLNNEFSSVMVFGHNPAFTEIISLLTEEVIDNLPTTGVVEIEFDIDAWKDIQPHKGVLSFFEYPKKEEK